MTTLKKTLAFFVALFFTSVAFENAAAQDSYAPQKVVYHINYDGTGETSYRSALGNIQNHINAVGSENLEIKVVLHGDGLGLLMSAMSDDALQTRIVGLKSENVSFQVCNNTLVGRDISWRDDLYDTWEEDIVPSGVAEVAKLQHEGYAYIKP